MLVIIMLEQRVVGVVGLDAAGRARASRQGIRQFVVGTGGADLLGFAAAKPNSQRRLAGVHGVLACWSWSCTRPATSGGSSPRTAPCSTGAVRSLATEPS